MIGFLSFLLNIKNWLLTSSLGYINKITPTLLELVQIYPEKYMEEFVKEYLNSIETENKNYNTIYDKVEDLKGYLEEIKNDTVEDSKNNEKKN